MSEYKKESKVTYLPLFIIISLVIGIILGVFFMPRSNVIRFVSQDNKINEAINIIERYYFDDVDEEQIKDEAITGMLLSLDPHSSYINKSESAEYNEKLQGEFDGIGIQFNTLNDTVLVINVIAGGPSQKIGLQAGDKIIRVDGENIAGVKMQNSEIISKLKGPRGTKVKVEILRSGNNDLLDFEIIRDKIPLESISVAYMMTDKIGYILIDNFSTTTGQEFAIALRFLKNQNMKKLILDLRGNSGGYLGAAIDICDEFLNRGKLIVYTEGKSVGKQEFKATSKGMFEEESQELVVLIDEWSASASEIVAGAIQDQDRGTIIGRRSFGKGLVQRQFYLSDSSEIMLTVARYFTPTGRCIQKPFENTSNEEYLTDILNRYQQGEMENADSVKLTDTAKYITPKGKIVYGGGGIMPDIFVPIERSEEYVYFNSLSSAGVIFNFAMNYTDKNREYLKKYKTIKEFDKNFIISDAMLEEILKAGEEKGVKREISAFSKKEIIKWTKAYIARNLFQENGFYYLINKDDKMVKKAIEVLED